MEGSRRERGRVEKWLFSLLAHYPCSDPLFGSHRIFFLASMVSSLLVLPFITSSLHHYVITADWSHMEARHSKERQKIWVSGVRGIMSRCNVLLKLQEHRGRSYNDA